MKKYTRINSRLDVAEQNIWESEDIERNYPQ